MRFNSSIPYQRENAINYFQKLIEEKRRFEIKRIFEGRTIQQNSYLHLLFSLYGLHFGLTLEEAKQDIKRDLGYTYIKNEREYFKHTSEMNTKELTDFIEKFRSYSSTLGLYLPKPNEISDEQLNEIDRNQNYLTGKFYEN